VLDEELVTTALSDTEGDSAQLESRNEDFSAAEVFPEA
jgi:hypothetical protein